MYEAFGRGDVEAILERVTDDVDWSTDAAIKSAPWYGPKHGKEGVRSFFEAIGKTGPVTQFTPLSLASNDDGDVMVLIRYAFTVTGLSPGADRRAVAAQELGLVLVPGGGGPVRVQHQRPAPPVNRHLVVKGTEQHAVFGAGLAAVGLVLDMMNLARGGGLVTSAGPPAAL